MLIKKPAETVEVCDLCQRTGYLQTCTVCGRQYCLACDGTVVGSFGFVDVCRDCGNREDVNRVCEKYAKRLTPIYMQRQRALAKLPKKEKR